MFQRRSPRPATRMSASTRRCTGEEASSSGKLTARTGACTRGTAGIPLVSLIRESVRRAECQNMPETTATERDARHLQRAIELAGRARGQTSPNPIVGAVVVKDGRVMGEVITQPPGQQHAETMALAACEGDTAGATMYVSLEPCCHQGRTPPCTEAILGAGIARVVIASDDPTPKAAGRGPGILRDEGVRVDFVDGEIGELARMLNQPFRKHARTGRPLVVFKSAMTLDGKVATRTGDSQWISGEASRARAHRSRAAARTSVQALEAAGVDVIVATGENEAARVEHALDELGARDIQSLLLEGGPHLAGAFLEAGEIDEARMFVAPLMLGGAKAKTAVEGIGLDQIAGAARAP